MQKIEGSDIKDPSTDHTGIESKQKRDERHTTEFQRLRFGITNLGLNLVTATYQQCDLGLVT